MNDIFVPLIVFSANLVGCCLVGHWLIPREQRRGMYLLAFIVAFLIPVIFPQTYTDRNTVWAVHFITAIIVFPFWFAIVLVMRRKRPPKLNECGRCGYDLRGNRSGACPECGAVIEKGEESGGKAEKGV